MLTIADEGGRVREKFDKMGLKVPKMCVKETQVKPSLCHICFSALNNQKAFILSHEKVFFP